jgi:hypothetical protein
MRLSISFSMALEVKNALRSHEAAAKNGHSVSGDLNSNQARAIHRIALLDAKGAVILDHATRYQLRRQRASSAARNCVLNDADCRVEEAGMSHRPGLDSVKTVDVTALTTNRFENGLKPRRVRPTAVDRRPVSQGDK